MSVDFLLTAKQEPPAWTRQPTDKEVREGQKAKFDAAATGIPRPSLTWYLSSELILGYK